MILQSNVTKIYNESLEFGFFVASVEINNHIY